jgi:hypothetical protein
MLSVARDAGMQGDEDKANSGTTARACPPRPASHGPFPPGSARRELHQYAAAKGNSRFVVELLGPAHQPGWNLPDADAVRVFGESAP